MYIHTRDPVNGETPDVHLHPEFIYSVMHKLYANILTGLFVPEEICNYKAIAITSNCN